MVIVSGHMIGDASVTACVTGGNIWCGSGYPISVNDNCLVICGGGTGNVGNILCVIGPGLVMISTCAIVLAVVKCGAGLVSIGVGDNGLLIIFPVPLALDCPSSLVVAIVLA